MRLVRRFPWRVGTEDGGQVQLGGDPEKQHRQVLAKRGAIAEDGIGAVDKDRIRVMLACGEVLRLRGRLRVRLGKAVAIFVVMMVTAGTVVMVAVFVTIRSTVRVEVRTEIVSGGLDAGV